MGVGRCGALISGMLPRGKVVVLSLIMVVSTFLASETFQEDIAAERPKERRAIAGEPG